MTVYSNINRWSYVGNGVTTTFPFNNRIFETTDLQVFFDGVLQNSGYTITGVNDPVGGSVTFAVAPASQIEIELVRKVPSKQGSDYRALGAFPAEITEENLDKATVLVQQVEDDLKRTIRLQTGESFSGSLELPPKEDRANRNLGFDAEGNVSASVPMDPGALNATAFGETILSAANPPAGRSIMGAASEAELNAVKAYLVALAPIGKIEPMLTAATPDGWLELIGQTVGSATSGATVASNFYHDFFIYVWNTLPDAPITPGVRGLTAAADWSANKRIGLPDLRGRTIIGAGVGSGLTLRMLGAVLGEESHLLTSSETGVAPHSHEGNWGGFTGGGDPAKPYIIETTPDVPPTGGAGVRYTRLSSPQNAAAAHNNMQPSFVARWMVWTGVYPNAQPLNLADLGFEWLGVWNSATAYGVGDVVRHDASGATYIATAPSTNSVPNRTGFVSLNANWALVSVDGVAGNNGVFVWKGAWSGAAIYAIGDVVTLAGSTYRCITAHNNQTPPNVLYWEALALKGDTGVQGNPGLLTAIEQDLAPKLGADLIVNDKKIVSGFNKDIILLPGGGTGKIKLHGIYAPTTDGLAGQVRTTDGLGNEGYRTLPAIIGQARGLKAGNNAGSPNSKVDISIAEILVKDATTGDIILLSNVNLTLDITADLDTGSETPSTYYYGYVFYNKAGAGTVAGRFSASSTAPTAPAGYTYKALVTVVRNDASSNFWKYFQVGREITLAPQLIFTAQAGILSWTAQSISNAVPPIATKARGNAGLSNSTAQSMAIAVDATGLGERAVAGNYASGGIDSWVFSSFWDLPLQTAQQLWWKASTTSALFRWDVTGFEI